MIISNYVALENKEEEERREEHRPIFGWVKHENVGQKLHSTLLKEGYSTEVSKYTNAGSKFAAKCLSTFLKVRKLSN